MLFRSRQRRSRRSCAYDEYVPVCRHQWKSPLGVCCAAGSIRTIACDSIPPCRDVRWLGEPGLFRESPTAHTFAGEAIGICPTRELVTSTSGHGGPQLHHSAQRANWRRPRADTEVRSYAMQRCSLPDECSGHRVNRVNRVKGRVCSPAQCGLYGIRINTRRLPG